MSLQKNGGGGSGVGGRESEILKLDLEYLLYSEKLFRITVSLRKEKIFYLSNASLQKRENLMFSENCSAFPLYLFWEFF